MKKLIYLLTIILSLNLVLAVVTYTKTIGSITMDEDSEESINLDNYFEPKVVLEYEIVSEPTDATLMIDGATLTISPDIDWYGEFTFKINASLSTADESVLTGDIKVTVTNIEDSPELIDEDEGIPDQSFNMNQNLTLDLLDYFKHGDDKDMTFFLEANLTNIDAIFDEAEVTFVPDPDWSGNESVVIIAADEDENEGKSNTFTLEVKATNTPPTITSFSPELTQLTLSLGSPQEFSIIASDKNNDILEYQWYLDGFPILGQNLSSYTYQATDPGQYLISVAVSDGIYSKKQEWTVAVDQELGEEIIKEEGVCGNGVVEEGENCGTCPDDATCKEGYACLDNKCIFQEKKSNLSFILILIGVVIFIVLIFVFIYIKRKKARYGFEEKDVKEKLEKPAETPVGEAQKFKIGRNILNENPEEKKEYAKISPQPTTQLETPGLYPRQTVTPEVKEPIKTVDLVMLKNYIKDNINKGFSEEKIRQRLSEKGWSKEKIDKAFAEYKY
ncbi:MAG: hypothetical protein PHT54_04645 [Candidatus Nanoarchaeia archaeon]|nr:hypothetical protein [Candidatus Nanoarchaeia archaeon]